MTRDDALDDLRSKKDKLNEDYNSLKQLINGDIDQDEYDKKKVLIRVSDLKNLAKSDSTETVWRETDQLDVVGDGKIYTTLEHIWSILKLRGEEAQINLHKSAIDSLEEIYKKLKENTDWIEPFDQDKEQASTSSTQAPPSSEV